VITSTPTRKELQPPAAAKKQRRAAFPGCKGGERQGVQDHSLWLRIMEAANAEPVMLQGQLVQCKGVANQVKCLPRSCLD